jgi:prenyltransferase beta subunit
MNLWERFLRTIYKTAATPFLKRYQKKSIESVLQKSTTIINVEIREEIKNHIRKSVTTDGGFADRGGKSDIYYSLFGGMVAEALSVQEVIAPLKNYVKRVVEEEPLKDVSLFCGAILYAKLHRIDTNTNLLRQQVEKELIKSKENNSGYHYFMGLLALYYLQDYRFILKLKKQIKKFSNKSDAPCSLAAAEAVINRTLAKSVMESEIKLKVFYRGNGGFVALPKAPIPDLLSTAVALYALHFIDSDLTNIKPECLNFIDGLYLNGGFRATDLDFDIDIEYTFYGLLALGTLA